MSPMPKVKRTYNLSSDTVRAVREMADDYGVADSQDAVVELAVDELRRHLADAAEARIWATARLDADFRREVTGLEAAYRSADDETWPR
jgi:hypothetical protein